MEKKEKGKREPRTSGRFLSKKEGSNVPESFPIYRRGPMVVVFEYENEVETSNEYVSRPEISVLV